MLQRRWSEEGAVFRAHVTEGTVVKEHILEGAIVTADVPEVAVFKAHVYEVVVVVSHIQRTMSTQLKRPIWYPNSISQANERSIHYVPDLLVVSKRHKGQ